MTLAFPTSAMLDSNLNTTTLKHISYSRRKARLLFCCKIPMLVVSHETLTVECAICGKRVYLHFA
jgi:hypothetical protein